MTEQFEAMTTRGRFLKQLGATLAVGVGAAAFASAARADHTAGHCCPSGSGPCTNPGDPTSCGGQQNLFHCNCSGIGQDYCICTTRTECYNGPC